MKNGNNVKGTVLTKDNKNIVFDIPIYSKEGILWCIDMQRVNQTTGDEATFAQITYNIQQGDGILGHMHT